MCVTSNGTLAPRFFSSARNCWRRGVGRNETQPILKGPSRDPARRVSVIANSKLESTWRACSANTFPAGVASTAWLVRMKSTTPSSCSSLQIAWDRGGCAIFRRSAARPKCSSSKTARKYRRWRCSIPDAWATDRSVPTYQSSSAAPLCCPGRGDERVPLVGADLVVDPAKCFLPVPEGSDDSGIELRSCLRDDLVDGCRPGCGLAVRPVARDRVERVGDREDAGRKRYLVAHQAVRVATAVPAFMVGADDLRAVAAKKGRVPDHLLAEDRMGLDQAPFRRGERF